MQTIPITLAQPGMTLEQPVLHPNKPDGMPIFGANRELTIQIIDRLKLLGIPKITIKGHPVQLAGDETLEQALDKLEQRFAALQDNAYMMKIHDLLKEQIIHRHANNT